LRLPIKILHAYKVYRPDLEGGIISAISTLCHDDSEIDNEILVARNKGWSRQQQVDGIPVEAVSALGTFFSTPAAPSYPFILRRRAKAFDIVVHHAPFPLTDLIAPHLPEDISLIVYWHADIVGRSFLGKIAEPLIVRTLRRANRIVVADQSTINGSPILREFAAKCSIIPYGIDLEYWENCTAEETQKAKALRTKYPRLILGIGRLVPYKGFEILLQALQKVEGNAILVGEGPLRGALEQLAEKLGVADRVIFAGRLSDSDVKVHIHAASVLAFPSVTRAEAFGLVQVQAMAAGVPVVNTALDTAVPTIARHDKEGLTVAPGEALALANALNRILDDPILAGRLGQAASVRVKSEYDERRYLARIKLLYQQVLAERAR
jgi:glycosyltransferase involved in cell wall biosynthesis